MLGAGLVQVVVGSAASSSTSGGDGPERGRHGRARHGGPSPPAGRWKRWLNIAIAALAAANIVLGFVEFGYRQAAGALAIVAGALAYATAARRALSPAAGGTTALHG